MCVNRPVMGIKDASVAVLMPAYNEENQIGGVLDTVPAYVDAICVVDDGSVDATAKVVEERAALDPRIHLIQLEKNRGVGTAIATAYIWAREEQHDVVVTVDADGQMSWDDLEHICMPIVNGQADVAKGNRLWSPTHWRAIPKIRLFGNAALSLLTKIASGYWSVADSQTGYVACSRYAVDNIEWEKLYRSYGRPNDLLVRANVANCRIIDIPIRPVYGVGERSTMKVGKVLFGIAFLLFRRFWWRLFTKYVLRDFHPLVFFYLLSTVSFLLTIPLAIYMGVVFADTGRIPQLAALLTVFLGVTGLNSVFFAFWMDMQVNAPLAVRTPDQFEIRQALASEVDDEPEGS
jgi:glycosyltransferase involved in cell wall biosynthesis